MLRRASWSVAVGAFLAASALPSWVGAQGGAFPSRPIVLVVPYGPGGAPDVVARIIADEARAFLGQPLVVENRAGAAGSIGTASVVRAAPDGHTVLVHTSVLASEPAIKKTLSYDVTTDLKPAMLISEGAFVLIVNPSVPAKNLAELIEYARQRPGKLNFGSAGTGSSGHLRGELFKYRTGIDMVHVPYVDGAGSMRGLLGNEVQMVFDTTPGARGPVEAGRVRAVVVTSAKREPVLPDVPTMQEAGIADFVNPIWIGAYLPAATPREVVDRLHDAFAKAISTDRARTRLAAVGMLPIGANPDTTAEILKNEIALWRKVVEAAKITIQ